MIYTLMRRDVTWTVTLILTLAGALAGAFSTRLSVLTLNAFVIGLIATRPHQRATLFEATLPISTRDLFLSRTLSRLAMVWLPALAASASMLLFRGVAAGKDVETLLGLASCLSFGLQLVLSSRIQELSARAWLLPVLIPFLFGVGPLMIEVPVVTPVIALVCAICGILSFWRAWESLPNSFQVAPLDAAAPHSVRHASHPAPFTSLPLWRAIYPWQNLVWLPILLLQPATGQWGLACIFAMTSISSGFTRMSWLFTLPIQRGRLLACMVGPIAAAMLIGFFIGAQGPAPAVVTLGSGQKFQGFSEADRYGTPNVQVTQEFWKLAPAGRAPVIRAPWGEAYVPPAIELLGLTFYNPYSVGPRNSERFLEWQFGNATEAIYGNRFTVADFKAGQLSPARLQEHGWKPLTRQVRYLVLELMAMWSSLLLMAWVVELSMSWRIRALSRTMRTVLAWGLIVGPAAAVIALLFIPSPYGTKAGTFLLTQALLWVLNLLPRGVGPVAALAIAVVGLMWWVAVKLADDVEIATNAPARTLLSS